MTNPTLSGEPGTFKVQGSLVPTVNEYYDLGSTTNRWKDLFLSGTTIHIGTTSLSADPVTGGLVVATPTSSQPLTGGGAGSFTDITASNVQVDGTVSAATFIGDGSLLTGIVSGGGGGGGESVWTKNGANVYVTGSNVGIGKTNPQKTLDVVGDVGVNGTLYMTGNVMPTANETYDLGSPDMRFRELYLSGNTIYLGSNQISVNEAGQVDVGNVFAENFIGNNLTATNITAGTASIANLAVSGTLDAKLDTNTVQIGTTVAQFVNIGTSTLTQTINVGTGSGVTTINIGGVGDTVNIAGTLTTVNTTNTTITDNRITLNKGGAAGSGAGAGFTVEEDETQAGHVKTTNTREGWELKAPATSGVVTVVPGAAGFEISGSNMWTASGTTVYRPSGGVGIGTVPVGALDVVGTVKATSFVGDGSLLTGIVSSGGSGGSSLWSQNAGSVYVTGSNVGIGTSSPVCALHVNDISGTSIVTTPIQKYPPSAMSSNSLTAFGGAYGNGVYTSSTSSDGGGAAWEAFNFSKANEQWWMSSPNYMNSTNTSTGGTYTGSVSTTASGQALAGEWLQIQLPVSLQITSYVISPRQSSTYDLERRNLRTWWLLGSTDGITWTIINTQDGILWTTYDDKTFTFEATQAYTYLRIVCNKVGNPGTGDNLAATVGELAFYGTVTTVTQLDGNLPSFMISHVSVPRATITNSGNVGFGTTNPQQKLHVEGTVKATSFVGDGSLLTGLAVPSAWSQSSSNVYVTGTNVGIGTTNPQKPLDIVGDFQATSVYQSNVSYSYNPTWTSRVSAADNTWFALAWSPQLSLFAAVSDTGTGNRVMTSPDGITWTTRASAADIAWYGICWAAELSLFVAVANSGSGNRVMTSSNGITWTIRTSAADNGWRGVTWSPQLSLLVAVANSGSGNRIMTSPNGINWTARTSPADINWTSVCWSPELSLFVAVAYSGSGNSVMTSPNGINWTARTASNNQWLSVVWASHLSIFVAVATTGTNRVMTSSDGITWTERTAASAAGWRNVSWVPELSILLALGESGEIMTSPDGITWSSRTSGANNGWLFMVWAPQLYTFVAVGSSGTGNRVMTSSAIQTTTTIPSKTLQWNQGNFGINTATPTNALHVVGDTRIEGNLIVNGTQTIINTNMDTTEQLLITNNGTGPALVINQTGAQPVLDVQDDGVSVMKIIDGGNVGMGTTLPQQKLHVVGTIKATSFVGDGSLLTGISGGGGGGGSGALITFGDTQVAKHAFGGHEPAVTGDYYVGANISWLTATTSDSAKAHLSVKCSMAGSDTENAYRRFETIVSCKNDEVALKPKGIMNTETGNFYTDAFSGLTHEVVRSTANSIDVKIKWSSTMAPYVTNAVFELVAPATIGTVSFSNIYGTF
jgi:hypothetical protein